MNTVDDLMDEQRSLRLRLRISPKSPAYRFLSTVADPNMRNVLAQALCDVAVTAIANGIPDHKGARAIAALYGDLQAQMPVDHSSSPKVATHASTPPRKRRSKQAKTTEPASPPQTSAGVDDLQVPHHLGNNAAFATLTGFDY